MKKFFLVILAVAASASVVFAHPPSDLNLEYDPQNNVLHVSMTHVISGSMREHHIREISLFKNETEYSKHFFAKQTSGSQHIADLPLVAKTGDEIRIKAVCKKAGYAEAVLTIP